MSHLWLGSGVASAGLAFFFALANVALRTFSRARLEALLERRGRRRDLERVLARHDELLRTTALLQAVFLVAMTALLVGWSASRWEGIAAWAIGAVVSAAAAAVLGVALPAAWARVTPESVLAAVLPPLWACRMLMRPADRGLGAIEALVRRLAGVPRGKQLPSQIEEELRTVVHEGEREGTLEEHQKDMIEGVIRFPKTDVSRIMTPRTDIVALDAGAHADEARRLVVTSGHSRIPLTAGSVDAIVGVLYAKDLLAPPDAGAVPGRVRDLMRPALFVPATKRLDELLAEFRRAKVHMAVVLDEYGGTAGLVTIEDVIEEIFGEIADEYEEAPPQPIRRVGPGTFEVEARVHVDELNAELGLRLPEDEDYETIGGLLLSRLGSIPKAGQTLQCRDVRITVLEAEERRVNRVRLDLALPAATGASGGG